MVYRIENSECARACRVVGDDHLIHTGASRTPPDLLLEPSQRVRVAGGGNLDRAVRVVPDPSADAGAHRSRLCEVP